MRQEPAPFDLVVVISDLEGGGTQRVLSTLVNEWNRLGIRVCVISIASAESDRYLLAPGVPRISLGLARPSKGFTAALLVNLRRVHSLRLALRSTRSPTVLSFIGATNILTILATRGLRLRVVISERNDPDHQSLGRPWDFLRRLLYRRADVITANSAGALHSLSAHVPRSKLAHVPNPLLTSAFADSTPASSQTILNVASLTRQKAHDVLLAAFADVSREFPEWRLSIAGEGPLAPALASQASALDIASRINWLGWIPDIAKHYARAAIFVLPSRFEGTPNALLEAMASGLPVIVTDASPGPLEYVDDGVTGLVVPADDVAALSNALRRLAANSELREKLGGNARNRVRSLAPAEVIPIWNRILRLTTPDSTPSI
jgi:GalNAc-alpha-(1->4)-GalNAc-alpha-(1->3)-diNAcBac-PP-undecaprenol alpha-1,4-N-acetyl-D-galactosaminyltransferase